MDWLFYEKIYTAEGKKVICGVDEAGRGPLAGPVYAAAVVLPDEFLIEGVNDSKKLTPRKREYLYNIIVEKAKCYSIASVSAETIDKENILNATLIAMNKAIKGLKIVPDIALIDGKDVPENDIECHAIIKGDALSHSIACASILAKVSRDAFMKEEAKKYPWYAFEKHKGYGTKLHIDMIKKHGTCPLHRKTFLKKILKYE